MTKNEKPLQKEKFSIEREKRQEEDLIIGSGVKEMVELCKELEVEEEKETQNEEIQVSQENQKEVQETKEEDKEVKIIQDISDHIQVTKEYDNL
jgi:vacuolar-type H+-ATPase subunit H